MQEPFSASTMCRNLSQPAQCAGTLLSQHNVQEPFSASTMCRTLLSQHNVQEPFSVQDPSTMCRNPAQCAGSRNPSSIMCRNPSSIMCRNCFGIMCRTLLAQCETVLHNFLQVGQNTPTPLFLHLLYHIPSCSLLSIFLCNFVGSMFPTLWKDDPYHPL